MSLAQKKSSESSIRGKRSSYQNLWIAVEQHFWTGTGPEPAWHGAKTQISNSAWCELITARTSNLFLFITLLDVGFCDRWWSLCPYVLS